MPPERYVALEAHNWLLAGPLKYRYPDPEVDAHVRRVDELMRDWKNRDALRAAWLTPEELKQVQAEIADIEEKGYF